MFVAVGTEHGRRILCADEYETLLHTLAAVLPQFHYSVVLARSRDEVLTVARQQQVDLVLLDFRLCPRCPAGAGECLAEELRTMNPQARILVWCADGACLQQPPPCARATLVKPIAPVELVSILEAALEGKPMLTDTLKRAGGYPPDRSR